MSTACPQGCAPGCPQRPRPTVGRVGGDVLPMLHRAVVLSGPGRSDLGEAIALLESVVHRLEDKPVDARSQLAAARTALSSYLLAISAVRDARAGDESVARLVYAGADAALDLIEGARAPIAG